MVKLAGKRLNIVVNDFIMHMEKLQSESLTSAKAKKKDPTMLKNKILRESRFNPKLVFDMEQFNKSVTQLSNKSNCDLRRYMGVGITRDFRIKDLKGVLEQATQHTMDVDEDDDSSETTSASLMPPPKRPRK